MGSVVNVPPGSECGVIRSESASSSSVTVLVITAATGECQGFSILTLRSFFSSFCRAYLLHMWRVKLALWLSVVLATKQPTWHGQQARASILGLLLQKFFPLRPCQIYVWCQVALPAGGRQPTPSFGQVCPASLRPMHQWCLAPSCHPPKSLWERLESLCDVNCKLAQMGRSRCWS